MGKKTCSKKPALKITREHLRELAQELKIQNISSMTKEQLETAIEQAKRRVPTDEEI